MRCTYGTASCMQNGEFKVSQLLHAHVPPGTPPPKEQVVCRYHLGAMCRRNQYSQVMKVQS